MSADVGGVGSVGGVGWCLLVLVVLAVLVVSGDVCGRRRLPVTNALSSR